MINYSCALIQFVCGSCAFSVQKVPSCLCCASFLHNSQLQTIITAVPWVSLSVYPVPYLYWKYQPVWHVPTSNRHVPTSYTRSSFRQVKSFQLESTNKGGDYHSEDVTQTQQQRPEFLMVTLTWHASKYKVHKPHQRYIPSAWHCEKQPITGAPYVEACTSPVIHAGFVCLLLLSL